MSKTYVEKNCLACFGLIQVRLADHKRGWGNFCDKSCSAAYKTGQRPRDVNANHAKYSLWASQMMDDRKSLYNNTMPPKAETIEKQLGYRVKIKKKKHKS